MASFLIQCNTINHKLDRLSPRDPSMETPAKWSDRTSSLGQGARHPPHGSINTPSLFCEAALPLDFSCSFVLPVFEQESSVRAAFSWHHVVWLTHVTVDGCLSITAEHFAAWRDLVLPTGSVGDIFGCHSSGAAFTVTEKQLGTWSTFLSVVCLWKQFLVRGRMLVHVPNHFPKCLHQLPWFLAVRERESPWPCPLGPTSHCQVFYVSRPRCSSMLAQALSQHPCAPLQR